MFDLSWSEIMVIATVAIVFIGPKELPSLLRQIGQWTTKARALAREFQSNVDDMIRESELDELRKQVQNVQSGGLERAIEQAVDPKGEITKALAPPDLGGLNPSIGGAADIPSAAASAIDASGATPALDPPLPPAAPVEPTPPPAAANEPVPATTSPTRPAA